MFQYVSVCGPESPFPCGSSMEGGVCPGWGPIRIQRTRWWSLKVGRDTLKEVDFIASGRDLKSPLQRNLFYTQCGFCLGHWIFHELSLETGKSDQNKPLCVTNHTQRSRWNILVCKISAISVKLQYLRGGRNAEKYVFGKTDIQTDIRNTHKWCPCTCSNLLISPLKMKQPTSTLWTHTHTQTPLSQVGRFGEPAYQYPRTIH